MFRKIVKIVKITKNRQPNTEKRKQRTHTMKNRSKMFGMNENKIV